MQGQRVVYGGLLIVAMLAGCTQGTPAPASPSPLSSNPAEAGGTAGASPQASSVLTPVVSPGSTLTETMALPAGLTLALGSPEEGWALWTVGKDGALRLLMDDLAAPHDLPDFDIAPDHQRVLYSHGNDIWLFDAVSGEKHNVTATPEVSERLPRWWSNTADSFLCGSDSRPLEGPALGYLTRVDFAGNYEVLDDRGYLSAPPAPAPDGQRVLYSWSDQSGGVHPSLYETGQGAREFDLSAYGIDWVDWAGGASWSKDGKRLAWSLVRSGDGSSEVAEVVFDLDAKTHQIVHRYQRVPVGGFDPAPQWMPDNKSIVFYDFSADAGTQGLVIADLEKGRTEAFTPELVNRALINEPVVSPDGRWVIGVTPDKSAVGLVDMNSRTLHLWSAQKQVSAAGWLLLP